MKKLITIAALLSLSACGRRGQAPESQTDQDKAAVERQQSQYAKGQPIPAFDWSLERDIVIQLYGLRNQKVATHSVWRSDTGVIEGDCASLGYGVPYDTSLTNPLKADWKTHRHTEAAIASAVVSQPEPNGVFASTNTSATWVLCIDAQTGAMEPHYVESKVTVYPRAMSVDYAMNRVRQVAGAKAVTIKPGK